MGWKASSIIINSVCLIPQEEILTSLGFRNLVKINAEPYEISIFPNDNEAFIGTYKNNTIISAQQLPQLFIDKRLTDVEKKLVQLFPSSEICFFSLHSAINLWSYVIIKNGEKIGIRAGTSMDGTIINYGEPLAQELELLSKSKINDEGKLIYYLRGEKSKPRNEDYVGERFVFEILSRYTDIRLDKDANLLKTQLNGYKTTLPKPVYQTVSESTPKGKSWWKFWEN